MSNVNGESDVSPTKPQTTRTDGSFPRGNWEIPETSLSLERDRSGKARCHNPDMHVTGKSDSLVVHEKQANKAGPQTAAESVEERSVRRQLSFRFVLPQRGMLPEIAECSIEIATGNAHSSAARMSIPCCGV